MSDIHTIAVVGAGQAGASAVAILRALGFAGRLVLIGAEPLPPYQRPPLSKTYLMGEKEVDRLLLQPEAFYREGEIELLVDRPVTAIDRDSNRLRLADGGEIVWDRLLLATGAVPRRLPAALAAEDAPLHTIRTRDDVDRVAPAFAGAKSTLIVGGGYIGLEMAAIARHFGLDTTLIEAAPRILQRVAAAETADRFARLHRERGVDLREATGLTGLRREADGSCRVVLSDGTEMSVDFAVIGIGVDPDTGLAAAAGLEIDNGIAVDAWCRTSDERIFAAGDCASFPWQGRRIRLESVQNAIEQAEAAAVNMLGGEQIYDPVPWFWSDQYDVKLQIAGLNQGYDRVVARPGQREGASSVWYFAGERFLAVDAFNDAVAYMVGKRLLEAGRSPAFEALSDHDVPLKSLLEPGR